MASSAHAHSAVVQQANGSAVLMQPASLPQAATKERFTTPPVQWLPLSADVAARLADGVAIETMYEQQQRRAPRRTSIRSQRSGCGRKQFPRLYQQLRISVGGPHGTPREAVLEQALCRLTGAVPSDSVGRPHDRGKVRHRGNCYA